MIVTYFNEAVFPNISNRIFESSSSANGFALVSFPCCYLTVTTLVICKLPFWIFFGKGLKFIKVN